MDLTIGSGCRDANPAKDLIVAFAEDDSSILTFGSSNAWCVDITPKSIILSWHTASALHKGNLLGKYHNT